MCVPVFFLMIYTNLVFLLICKCILYL